MILLTILLPLLNFTHFLVFSRLVDRQLLARLVVASMFTLFLSLISNLPLVLRGDVFVTEVGTWMTSGLFDVLWTFSVDPLTYTMLLVVLLVSSLVHLYSTEYMTEDPHLPRFMSYLSLFTFYMLILVSADNFINLFLGWEGVGLCSFLLIGFWFTRISANKAAIKAMVVNRVADLFLTIGLLATFQMFGTTDFGVVFGLTPYFLDSFATYFFFSTSPLTFIALLLVFGAMGKSAQIGLHTWLPDAMEGPTPVSALIHAATMVTAGVFLIIRSSALFERTPEILIMLTILGAATALMAASAGLVQNDLKKVIAYSTCSQLGYMVFICGLSDYALSLFHLSNHALFKALLFLSAGAVIHSISGEQDLRRFGALIRLLPLTATMFLIGSLAIMGFPFLTGFYSKEIILESAAATVTVPAMFAYTLGLITAFFTAYYSLRLLQLAFYSPSRSPRTYLEKAHELGERMATSLVVLALGAIFFGYLGRDLFIGFGTPVWGGIIYQALNHTGASFVGEFLNIVVKMLPLLGSFCALGLILLLAHFNPMNVLGAHRFLSHKWYFDTVYNLFVNQKIMINAYENFKLIDRGLLEFFGPVGGNKLANSFGRILAHSQTGRVYDYALWIFISMAVSSYVVSALVGHDVEVLTFSLLLAPVNTSLEVFKPIEKSNKGLSHVELLVYQFWAVIFFIVVFPGIEVLLGLRLVPTHPALGLWTIFLPALISTVLLMHMILFLYHEKTAKRVVSLQEQGILWLCVWVVFLFAAWTYFDLFTLLKTKSPRILNGEINLVVRQYWAGTLYEVLSSNQTW